MSIRVLLVDDHTIFRQALRLLLDNESGVEVVGELGDGALVEDAIKQMSPDVIVMDVSMPESINGMELTRHLQSLHPALRVVALSGFCHRKFVMDMMDAGAIGYVVKSAAGEQLIRAIQSAVQGKMYLCPDAAATLVEASRRGSVGAQENKRLGRRETEVLRLLSEGMSSPQIANKMHIAPSTVDVHRRNIMDKLDLRTVAELTKYAIRVGLTSM